MSLYTSCLERFSHLHSSLSSSFWIKVRSWTFPSPNGTTYKPSLILCTSAIHITSIKEDVYFAYSNYFKEGKKKSVCFFRDLRLHSDRYDKKKREGKRREWRNPSFSLPYLIRIRPLRSELGLDLLRATVLLGHQLGQTALVDQDVRNLLLKLIGDLLKLGLAENDTLSEKHSHHFTISFL
nr:MAG TPA: hypothetical protein [Caudoviricetes sp.]